MIVRGTNLKENLAEHSVGFFFEDGAEDNGDSIDTRGDIDSFLWAVSLYRAQR